PGGTYTNTATVTSATADPTPGDHTTTQDTTANPKSHLSITNTDSADPVDPGQAFAYTVTVHNAGPSAATTLSVSDAVPSQFTVNSTSSSAGGSCTNTGNAVSCSLFSLACGHPCLHSFPTRRSSDLPGGTYTNTATVTSATADPTPGDHT